MSADDNSLLPESKLTRTKKHWAEEGRFLTGATAPGGRRGTHDRLPPGQHTVRNWPVLDLGLQPDVDLGTWRLEVFGEVDTPMAWNWSGFLALPQREFVSDIHCVTTWSRYDNHWQGLAVRDLLALVKPRPQARFVMLHSSDGYTTNLPLEDFAADDALLAHHWEGQPISAVHGGPMRLVVPHLYFWKSAKWLQRIEFRQNDAPGYWEVRGYHRRGDPWQEQRYAED